MQQNRILNNINSLKIDANFHTSKNIVSIKIDDKN